jgi:hypothetical protein
MDLDLEEVTRASVSGFRKTIDGHSTEEAVVAKIMDITEMVMEPKTTNMGATVMGTGIII